MIYFIFIQYMNPQNADNAKMLRMWINDKLREVYAINDFSAVRRWQ